MSTRTDRPWGFYEEIYETPQFKVKVISVEPGKRLSYQRHKQRAELWKIVAGEAKVTIDHVERLLKNQDVVEIQTFQLHRIENVGLSDLVFVEVQTGTYFGEDDIKRISDDFGR